MKADSKRWTQVEASKLPHEREALDTLREALPDHEPYRAWSNLEFIAKDGSIDEVDALVLTRKGLFLVEIRSRGGRALGRRRHLDLKGRLARDRDRHPPLPREPEGETPEIAPGGPAGPRQEPVPYVHALVYLSARDLSVRRSPEGRTLVYDRDERTDLLAIGEFLAGTSPEELADSRFRAVDASLARALTGPSRRPDSGLPRSFAGSTATGSATSSARSATSRTSSALTTPS